MIKKKENNFKVSNFTKLRKFIRYFFKCEFCNKRFNRKWHTTQFISNSNKHFRYYKCFKCENQKLNVFGKRIQK